MPMLKIIMMWWQENWLKWTKPSKLLDLHQQQIARLQASLYLSILIAGIWVSLIIAITGSTTMGGAIKSSGPTVIFFGLLIGLSKSRHYQLASGLFILGFNYLIYHSVNSNITSDNLLGSQGLVSYLIVPVIISAFFLPLRYSVFLMIANVLMAAQYGKMLKMSEYTLLAVFPFFSAAILVIASHFRNQVEAQNIARIADQKYALESIRDALKLKVDERDSEIAVSVTALQKEVTEHRITSRQLDESKTRFQAIFNSTFGMMGLVRSSGEIVEVNSSTLKFAELERKEMIGQSLWHILPSPIGDQLANRIDEVAKGEFVHFIERINNGKGDEAHLDFSLRPIITGERDEKDPMIVVEARDITELTHSQQLLRRLTSELINVQEEEKRRVSRELHDGAGQILTALNYRLTTAKAGLESDTMALRDVQKVLEDAINLCEGAGKQIRNLAHQLRPASLDDLGLNVALQSLCYDFANAVDLAIDYEGVDIDGVDLSSIGISYYRILQEGLTNIAKHANATQVWVALTSVNDRLQLMIEDNGLGCDPEKAMSSSAESRGIGISGIRERLEVLRGEFKFERAESKGCRLLVSVPFGEIA